MAGPPPTLAPPRAQRPSAGPARRPTPPPPRRSLPVLLLEGMRPKQWTKNAFVLAGVLFSGQWLEAGSIAAAVAVTLAFCLVSGATYLVNDAADAETDRMNPRTARRPIARGDLSPAAARAGGAVAAAVGLGLALAVNWPSAAVVAGFLAMQLAYSNGLKHVLFLDVMIIAAGFVLRALAGSLAVEVDLSSWLLLCTAMLALFLALSKRRGEAVALGGESSPQRPVLDFYSVSLLDELISVVTPTTLVVYALYAIDGARSELMLLTLPFVLYGIFRVLFLIHHHAHVTEEPDVVVWKDRPLLLCVLLWGVAAAIVSVTA